MANLVEEAQQWVREARERGKCLDKAKHVERRLEALREALGTGNTSIALGFGLIVVGAAVAFFIPPLGAGLAAGGGAAVVNGLGSKADAGRQATRELRWAVEDLKACLDGG